MWGTVNTRWPGCDGDRSGGPALLGLVGGRGVVAVTGEPHGGRRLARSLMTMLEGVPGHRVLLAADTLPGAPGLPLTELLDRVEHSPEPDPDARTFLFCGEPGPVDAIRIRLAAAHDERLTVVSLGPLPGAELTIRMAPDGTLTIDGFAGSAAGPEPARPPGPQPSLPRRLAAARIA